MLRPRVIPCLLMQDDGLVKTKKFKDPKYIGDPINAVRIFNEKEADELIILDIDATTLGLEPNYQRIGRLASECRMPLCYGGGIKTVEHARRIIQLGVEKIAISSMAIESHAIIQEIADEIGKQSVVVVLDIKKKFLSNDYEVWTHNATVNTKRNVLDVLDEVQANGAGEIVVNFVEQDGQMKGYPLEVIKHIKKRIKVPFTLLGGAGELEHLGDLIESVGIVGAAAGSLFVFKGKYRAVLINYPNQKQKTETIYGRL